MNNEQEQKQEPMPLDTSAHTQKGKAGEKSPPLHITEQRREKLKKAIVIAMLACVCSLSIWYIFTPSAKEKKEAQARVGLNESIPQASEEVLPADKLKAYSLGVDEESETKRQENLGNLYDYFEQESQKREQHESEFERSNPMNESVERYEETTRMLQNFHEAPVYDPEKEELHRELDELRDKLSEMENSKDEEAEQLALMEKSYQMAAKYLPGGQQGLPQVNERSMEENTSHAHKPAKASDKEKVLRVLPASSRVVSSLYQEISDSLFIAEEMQERNRSFLSPAQADSDELPEKNTLKVCVHESVTLKVGETVRLRLLEAARVANMYIPKNKLLTAIAKIEGNRLLLQVRQIEQEERILSVHLSAYDIDGQPGIFIPHSEEMNAVKEVVAGVGQSAGTSFTFSASAGQQLAADAGKGLMQGASQYLNKKMREVKVTLKSGHLLYLMPEE